MLLYTQRPGDGQFLHIGHRVGEDHFIIFEEQQRNPPGRVVACVYLGLVEQAEDKRYGIRNCHDQIKERPDAQNAPGKKVLQVQGASLAFLIQDDVGDEKPA